MKKTAVFTHHCPTFFNYPRQYKGSVLNEAFAVELFDLIEASDIAYWVFGHHHINVRNLALATPGLLPTSWDMYTWESTICLIQKKVIEL